MSEIVWLKPEIHTPDKNTDYLIWNEEESRQEIGWYNGLGTWISYMSIDPVVTWYADKPDDPA